MSYLLVTTLLFFAAGFLLWVSPVAVTIYRSKRGRAVALVFHAFAVFLGATPSRNLVSATLGLPPQNYDLAVSLLALIFYPLSWIFLVATIALAFYAAAWLLAAFCSL